MLFVMNDVKTERSTPSRRDRAKATAAAIVEAATVEFTANGYPGTTMAMIAARAGVAVQTVHFVFHTKGELLTAAVERAVLGGDDQAPPEGADWFRAILTEPDAFTQLRTFVEQSGPILSRASALNEVARNAAWTDPDVAATFQRLERLRWDGYRSLVEMLAKKGALHQGMDVDTATDALFTLMSPRTYLSLTVDRGWSAEQALAWLGDIVPAAILLPEV